MTGFDQAIEQLSGTMRSGGMRYCLSRFLDLLNRVGNPHHRLKRVVHVAGTNGKGSTCAYITQGLVAQGLNVGTFLSPHVWSYTERLCWNGVPISESLFAHLFSQVAWAVGDATEFELLTMMAFLAFESADVAVIEVGIGGRLDATNVVTPSVSVLTPIGLDHQDILGNSLAEIASEKAGIIKQGPVISAIQDPEVEGVIQRACEMQGVVCEWVKPWDLLPNGFMMTGGYQRQNGAVAERVLRQLGYPVNPLDLASARIPGRFSVGRYDGGGVWVDGAHNAHGLQAVLGSLPEGVHHLWIGVLARKELDDMVGVLRTRRWGRVGVYAPDEGWHPASDYTGLGVIETWDTVPDGLCGDVLVTGSFYWIGEAWRRLGMGEFKGG